MKIINKINRNIKIALLVLIVVLSYYGLQYAATAIHYNCYIIKDDCVPPINAVSESIYRVMVQPWWLDQFNVEPMTYFFDDGEFGFWEGTVRGVSTVIRVPKDGSAVMQWVAEDLPVPATIRPANAAQIKKWLANNPEQRLR